MPSQPMQPVVIDPEGRSRFQSNLIVRHLLDHGGTSLDDLGRMDFSVEDREQFAQLIGYSVAGYGELSYVRDSSYEKAARQAQKLHDKRSRTKR